MIYKVLEILNENSILKTSYTKPLVDAIKNRRKITFDYYGPRKPKKDSVRPGRRIKAEPFAIGLSKRGNLILRAWVEPPSVSKKGFAKTNWRTFMISRTKNMTILDEVFDGNRHGYKQGDDKSMSVTYISLDKSQKIKEPKKQTVKPEKLSKPISKQKPEPTKKELPQPKPEPTKKELPQPTKTELPKPEPKITKTELPKPEPQKKPEKLNKEPEQPKKEELPQPKPSVVPSKNPNDEKKDEINESIKRIKTLMLL